MAFANYVRSAKQQVAKVIRFAATRRLQLLTCRSSSRNTPLRSVAFGAEARAGKYLGYARTVVFVPLPGDCHVAIVPRNDNAAQAFGSEPPRVSGSARVLLVLFLSQEDFLLPFGTVTSAYSLYFYFNRSDF